MELQRISDALEIASLLTTYATAMDTQDWPLYRTVFTPDAHIDYSSAGAIVGSRDHVADWLSHAYEVVSMSMHHITNIESHIDGDVATVRAMFYSPMRLPERTGLVFRGGYHHHEFVRTADGWRSRYLREENRWSESLPAVTVAAM